jgi:anti-sigma-K factor RskA
MVAPPTRHFKDADRSGPRWFANTGWLAAAAALAFALLKPGAPGEPVSVPPTGTELRAQLLREDPVALRLPWSATGDAAATGARGEVIWSAERQQGVMHIEGLAANDPGQLQYQLWIFDKDRDERYPVDGGVFDIPAGATSVDVPIRATLPIDEPVLFAVTVEKPGGVMVSSRERIVLAAQPG